MVRTGHPVSVTNAYCRLSKLVQICAPPALDPEFKTIDFLALLDLAKLPNGFFSRVMQPQADLSYHGA